MEKLNIIPGPLGWGWVFLPELAEKIGYTPEETWRSFWPLSKDVEWRILSYSTDLVDHIQDDVEPDRFDIWVPAGWAMDVVAAHSCGAVYAQPSIGAPYRGYCFDKDGNFVPLYPDEDEE